MTLNQILDNVLAALPSDEAIDVSPGVHADQATARAARTRDDRPFVGYTSDTPADAASISLFHELDDAAARRVVTRLEGAGPVSYTHLTLPTIYSV